MKQKRRKIPFISFHFNNNNGFCLLPFGGNFTWPVDTKKKIDIFLQFYPEKFCERSLTKFVHTWFGNLLSSLSMGWHTVDIFLLCLNLFLLCPVIFHLFNVYSSWVKY